MVAPLFPLILIINGQSFCITSVDKTAGLPDVPAHTLCSMPPPHASVQSLQPDHSLHEAATNTHKYTMHSLT